MAQDNSPFIRQRAQLERKQNRRASYDRILIVSEGTKTEPLYFEEIRRTYRLHTANVVVQPSELGTQPLQVVQYARDLFENGDRHKKIPPRAFERVFAVFDRDDHRTYHDALALAASLNSKLRNDAKQPIDFRAVASVPCFELWLLLHFEDIQQPLHRDEVLRRIKRHIQGYEKGMGGSFGLTQDKFGIAHDRARRRAALECDGAAYHSSLSARDRDRLRQQILEGLGWTIYRVWSTDWFRDQERELTKMISFIEATLSERLVQQRDAEAKKAAFVQAVASEEDLESDLWENKIEDVGEFEELPKEQRLAESLFADTTIQPAQERLDMVEPVLGIYHEAVFDDLGLQLNEELFLDADYRPILTKLIERCVAVEGPIRDDVLARRIGTTHGFHRAGARIREQVLAIAHNLYKTTKEDVGVFFWPIGTRPDTWSTFRKSSGEPRPIDEISTPELRVLGLLALNDHRSSTEDVLVVMSRIAGLQRLRAASRERLDRAYKEARLNASQTSEIRPHLALLGGA